MFALYMSFLDDIQDKSKFEIVYYTYRKRMLFMADLFFTTGKMQRMLCTIHLSKSHEI